MPEKSLLTKEDLAEIAKVAASQGLSKAQAQSLVERESGVVAKIKDGARVAAQKEVDKLYETWGEQSKNDPEIGGEKFKETKALAKRAMNLDPQFKDLLLASPWANHPGVLKFLAKVGALTREDAPVGGTSVNAPVQKDARARWYPQEK